jgi:hypothetical protein
VLRDANLENITGHWWTQELISAILLQEWRDSDPELQAWAAFIGTCKVRLWPTEDNEGIRGIAPAHVWEAIKETLQKYIQNPNRAPEALTGIKRPLTTHEVLEKLAEKGIEEFDMKLSIEEINNLISLCNGQEEAFWDRGLTAYLDPGLDATEAWALGCRYADRASDGLTLKGKLKQLLAAALEESEAENEEVENE